MINDIKTINISGKAVTDMSGGEYPKPKRRSTRKLQDGGKHILCPFSLLKQSSKRQRTTIFHNHK